jgi:hypothetical protein
VLLLERVAVLEGVVILEGVAVEDVAVTLLEDLADERSTTCDVDAMNTVVGHSIQEMATEINGTLVSGEPDNVIALAVSGELFDVSTE